MRSCPPRELGPGPYRVVDSHRSRGVDLKGRVGTVDDAWEKCEEDPHCCCAELADEAAAVTVTMDAADGDDRGTFTYYFAEHELAQLPARVAAAASAAVAAAASAAQDVEPMLVAFRRGNPRTITRGRGVARTGEFCVVAASPGRANFASSRRRQGGRIRVVAASPRRANPRRRRVAATRHAAGRRAAPRRGTGACPTTAGLQGRGRRQREQADADARRDDRARIDRGAVLLSHINTITL